MSRENEGGLLRGAVETLRPIVRRLPASGVPFGMLEARLRELVVEDPADLVETMLASIFEEVGEPLLQRRVS